MPRAARFVVAIALVLASFVDAAAAARTLRVCAEPDNLPLSNARGEGFENRIAGVIADELHADLAIAWQPQRRGFVRKSIGADLCDVWIGVPEGLERLLTTRPYYRSSYVIVTRADAAEPLRALTDPRLATLRIGVQLVGDNLAATPPALALARAGALAAVVGYPVYGDGSTAERISADLAAGRLDAALVWGPQAGWFVSHGAVPLTLRLARPPADFELPFAFAISVGVARSLPGLRDEIDAALERRAGDVRAILDEYGVPQLDAGDRALAVAGKGGGR